MDLLQDIGIYKHILCIEPFYRAEASHRESNRQVGDDFLKRYIFASDFDQIVTFNDSGYVLAELAGIPTKEFEHKSKGVAKINLAQQRAGSS